MHTSNLTTARISQDPFELKVITKNMFNGYCIETEENSYPLRQTTKEELFFIRLTENAYFILKIQDQLFYTQIPSDLNLTETLILGQHCCINRNNCCKNFNPKTCRKVFDPEFSYRQLNRYLKEKRICPDEADIKYLQILQNSKCLENYWFVVYGCEIIGTDWNRLVVLECLNCK